MRNTMLLKTNLVATTFLLLAGCKPGAGTGNVNSANGFSTSGIICQDSGMPLADSAISGSDRLVSGQSNTLSLDASVDCAEAKQAVWSAGGVTLGKGSQISAKINGTGIYLVSVDSVANLASSKSISSKLFANSKVGTSALVGVTNSTLLIVGPQVGTEFNAYTFSLAVPTRTQLVSAEWNFNDGSPVVQSLTPVSHSFRVGARSVTVTTVDTNNQTTQLTHTISILPLTSGVDCPLENLVITGPTVVAAETISNFSLSEASCLTAEGTQITWNFGDGTSITGTAADSITVRHEYSVAGNYTLTATIRFGSGDANTVTLTREIKAESFLEQMPGPVPEPIPSPMPTPTPVPVDPNACAQLTATRTIDGQVRSRTELCGLNGQRENTYRDQITQVCQVSGENQIWTEQTRTEVQLSEGTCTKQSCQLATATGNQILTDGQTVTVYTAANPVGQCLAVQENRTCTNGVLSGSLNAQHLTCENGCADFGPNGTVKEGVIIGDASTPVACAFGEQGIVNVVHQIADRTCQSGQVITSNNRLGEIKTAGLCPVYNYVQTENWNTCSADCGGSQNRTFECRGNSGEVVSADRCTAVIPTESRICDGNLEAAKSSSTAVTEEEIGSSAVCPKNQIGVITQERSVTVTINKACVNHQISEVSRDTVATPYVTTTYCRDLVTARCSHDSLSNQGAAGRHQWMLKCQNEVPLIKEFLQNFEQTKYKNIGLNNTARHLYPTFMETKNKRTWNAPTNPIASCAVPATAYIAAVCVSSCATPDQTIIAKAKHDPSLQEVKFIDALTANMAWVGTLQSNSIMSSKDLQKTAVENWVTELVDTVQPVLTFKLKSGGEVKLTSNHAVLHESGMMKMASEFKVGDNLLQLGAKKDEILSITQSNYNGKVYNVFVKSNDLKKNVVVINGYLAGTAFYQNEGATDLNRSLFKQRLIKGVLEK